MTSYPITHIDGLDADEVKTLRSLGIRTTERLLDEAKSPKARRRLAERCGIRRETPAEICQRCDHMRIKGMGKGYLGLLQEVGVDTVRELRYRKPENLARAMAEANERKRLVRFLRPRSWSCAGSSTPRSSRSRSATRIKRSPTQRPPEGRRLVLRFRSSPDIAARSMRTSETKEH